jgi:hypothetical protein
VNITGWQLQVGGTVYNITATSISANGFLVLTKNSFSPKATGAWLPNSPTTVKLLNSTGFVVDQTTYPAIGTSSTSWSRYVNETGAPVDTGNDAYDFYIGKKTPGSANDTKGGGVIPEFDALFVLAMLMVIFTVMRRRQGRGNRSV